MKLLVFLLLTITASIATVSSSIILPSSPSTTTTRPLAWLNPHGQSEPRHTHTPTHTHPPSFKYNTHPQTQTHTRLIPAYGSAGRGGNGRYGGGRGRGGGGMGGGGGGDGGIDLSSWTNRLLALNVAIFILQQVDPSVTLMGAKNDILIRRGELHRLFTPMVLHGDIQHLLANSYTMYNLGHFIEPLFGGGMNYLALYVLSGFAGNYMSFASRQAPISIGASTAVSGLLGAVGVFCVRHRQIWNLDGPLRSVAQAILINGVMGASSRNIDNFGHLGGLLGGIVCGFVFGPRLVKLETAGGAFRGYVNRPLLQTAYRSLRQKLSGGKLVVGETQRGQGQQGVGGGQRKERQGWSIRPDPQQHQQKSQQQSQQRRQGRRPFGWLARLSAFLHRGGEGSEGGAGGRMAFIGGASPSPSSLSALRAQQQQQQQHKHRLRAFMPISSSSHQRTPYTTGVPLCMMYPQLGVRR